jgi:hypothetical protein
MKDGNVFGLGEISLSTVGHHSAITGMPVIEDDAGRKLSSKDANAVSGRTQHSRIYVNLDS